MIVNSANKDPAFFNEKVWPVVGSSLKIGTLEDYKNQQKLLKVLRWQSSVSEGETTTLDEYMSRRKQGQSQIFYIAGSGMERADLEKSPFVEKIIARGYEVLYFTVSGVTTNNLLGSDANHRTRLTKWWPAMCETSKACHSKVDNDPSWASKRSAVLIDLYPDVAKEGLKYGDDEDDEAETASIMVKFQPLAIFLQEKLKDAVKKGKFDCLET